jgi:hypothetical protein
MPIFLTISVLILLVLLTDPFMVFMNAMQLYIVLALFTGVLAVWVGIVVREESKDERDLAHRAFAARMGYLAGVSVLGAAVVYQALVLHAVSVWSLCALATMLMVKLFARMYIESRN